MFIKKYVLEAIIMPVINSFINDMYGAGKGILDDIKKKKIKNKLMDEIKSDLLKQYGSKDLYTELSRLIRDHSILEETYQRCYSIENHDFKTNDDFIKSIADKSILNQYDKKNMQDAVKYIFDKTFNVLNKSMSEDTRITINEIRIVRNDIKRLSNDIKRLNDDICSSDNEKIRNLKLKIEELTEDIEKKEKELASLYKSRSKQTNTEAPEENKNSRKNEKVKYKEKIVIKKNAAPKVEKISKPKMAKASKSDNRKRTRFIVSFGMVIVCAIVLVFAMSTLLNGNRFFDNMSGTNADSTLFNDDKDFINVSDANADLTTNQGNGTENSQTIYQDGVYFARDEIGGRWTYFVTVIVEKGKITDAYWGGTNFVPQGDKRVLSENHEYGMVAWGGAQSYWYEQAESAEAWLIKNQDPAAFEEFYTDEEGHTEELTTDGGAMVTVHVIEFFDLAAKALASDPIPAGNYGDAPVVVTAKGEVSSNGWQELAEFIVVNGTIVAVDFDALYANDYVAEGDGANTMYFLGDEGSSATPQSKDQLKEGYGMLEAGSVLEWYQQAELLEAYIVKYQDIYDITADGYVDGVASVSIDASGFVALFEEMKAFCTAPKN